MNPLPRILGMALFVVLAVLAALLAAPAWRGVRPDPAAGRNAPVASATAQNPVASAAVPPRTARLVTLPQQTALALALSAVVLAGVLAFSLVYRPAPPTDSKSPFRAAQSEIGTLARLAESSVAQGTELTRERDVRRRAEEDAQLKQQLLTRSLEEKIRLGRDLHDGIIQSLYAVGLTLEAARGVLRDDPAEADRKLEQCRAVLNKSIREARAYITGLAPESLRRAGFSRALETLLAELRADRSADFEVEVDEDATALLSAEQTLEALQIAREAVSNALRHGRASRVKLRVHQGDREVCLLIQDNGAGFDVTAGRDGGHGLGNMHARAASVGATLRVTSQPAEGTRVVATFPVLQPAPAV
jgi:signal transduction histidine kinase